MTTIEDREQRLAALREHLAEGRRQAERGEFVRNYSIDALIGEMDLPAHFNIEDV
jgi:antitoxin ParD1/3/4